MKRAIIAGLALLAGACAGSRGERGGDTVSEADYGRLQPNQTQQVDDARQQQLQAQDELARAKLRMTDVQHEQDLAKADQTAADADMKRAQAETKIAGDSNDPGQKQRGQELTQTATLHKNAADAHLDYAKSLVEARQAEVDAAQKRVDLMAARVNHAKLQAMQQSQIPAAGKYDAAAITNKVTKAENDYTQAMQKARDLDTQATAAQGRWQDLNRQLQARMGGTNRG
ncbi:hypothetical protein [Anaeromyxobacter paludicola]|uniref:Lipoprotein n=1 Tax=Anaeromyxobacter paludicola TaxID=2918171 RepID=A0ABN6NC57_9BACT|nr:hypothetical protein [Anaeromyxobacter paludicola]BDG09538.1 hypothetical protein AMPC_26510 [Anaeromyxobacter paludicola]